MPSKEKKEPRNPVTVEEKVICRALSELPVAVTSGLLRTLNLPDRTPGNLYAIRTRVAEWRPETLSDLRVADTALRNAIDEVEFQLTALRSYQEAVAKDLKNVEL